MMGWDELQCFLTPSKHLRQSTLVESDASSHGCKEERARGREEGDRERGEQPSGEAVERNNGRKRAGENVGETASERPGPDRGRERGRKRAAEVGKKL